MRDMMKAKADKLISIYLELQNAYKWRANDISLRFAAFVYTVSDKDFNFDAFKHTVDIIRKNTSYFSYYRSTLLYSLAAQLTTRFDDAERAFRDILKINADMFRRGFINSSYLGVASFAIASDGLTMETGADLRIKKAHDLYRQMHEDHLWMTGPDDYVSAVLLSGLPGTAEEIAANAEEYYDELRAQGFMTSNGLQFLSHMLVFSGIPASEAAAGCRYISDYLKKAKMSVSSMYFGAIGLLTVLGNERDQALTEAEEMVEYLKRNWNFKWFFKEMNVLIITSLVAIEYAKDKIAQAGSPAPMLRESINASVIAASAAAVSAAVTGASTN